MSYVFFLVQKSDVSVVFDAISTTNFLRKKKKKTIEATGPPDPPGLSALKMKSLEVPKGPKREVIQRHAAMQRLPLTTKPKVWPIAPGLQAVCIS